MNKDRVINSDYVKSYCASYTNNILDTTFKESPYLTGSDLRKLCSPEQINYNLLKAIFLQWETEVNKMQNPYFDHSAPAVQNALKTYMQVLSRNIKLDKGNLRPLLQQAVEETIYQIFCPAYFFENSLWPAELGSVKLIELAKLNRFIKINGGFLSELIAQLRKKHQEEMELSQFRYNLKNLCKEWQGNWESEEPYIFAFSKVVALHQKSLWKDELESVYKEENPKNINQRFTKDTRSLNDSLQTSQTTLADRLNENVDKLNNIRKSLNINQKFRFINELYGGDSTEFNVVLDQIDQCENYRQAMDILNGKSSLRSQWDMENEAVKEFLSLVSRRFSEPGPAFDEHPFSAK